VAANTPLAIPAFRRVWIGATSSAVGDAASWIALVALCVGPARGNLPVLAALYTAPVALGGLAAGWLLDRFDRCRVMIADSAVRAAAFASIPIAAAIGEVTAAQLYSVAAVYGLLKMVSLAGVPALIPSLVPERQLDQANALEGTSFGLASVSGAALAGLGIATVGATPVAAFDAATYLVLAAALLTVRPAPRDRAQPRARTGVRSVARLAMTNRVLRNTTIMFALFNIGEGCLLVVLPHRAVALGIGVGGYGYLVAAITGGELLATALLVTRPWRHPLQLSIVAAQLAAAAVVLLLIVPSVGVTVTALVALGLGSAPMTAWAQSLRMRLVPAEAHGRLFAVLRTIMQATYPLGVVLAALIVPHGTTATVLAISAVMGLPALLLGPALVRRAPRPAPMDADHILIASGHRLSGELHRPLGPPWNAAPRRGR
jgi:MFS family permease